MVMITIATIWLIQIQTGNSNGYDNDCNNMVDTDKNWKK